MGIPSRSIPRKLLERSGRRKPIRSMNAWESAYSLVLHARMLAGEIESYLFEPWHFALGARRHYTPDFLVWFPDGRVEAHEVKGYLWDRDAVRLDWFVREYPTIPLIVVRRVRGQWILKRR